MIDALVTGASGFIGQALCAGLRSKGWNIFELSSSYGDITALECWERLPPARVVFHLAARSFVPGSWECSSKFISTNIVGTENAIAHCRKHGSHLVMASAYVYGIPCRLPIRESHPIKPNNPYALSKRLSEQLCEFAFEYHGVTSTVLRLFNVFGPGQNSKFLIPSILQQLYNGREISVQDLAPRRDYVYISDVVDAFIKAGERNCGFGCINIGSGQSLSVQEVIHKIQEIAGTRLRVISKSAERNQEIPDVVADISLARGHLGWEPRVQFGDGIAQILGATSYEQ